jgi:hypothetical protein
LDQSGRVRRWDDERIGALERFRASFVTPQRIDYYDDPEAPRANSLVPSVNVAVTNEAGVLLLIRRTDNGVTGIVGIYSDPRHVILYTSDGEVRQEFSIVLSARFLRGRPTPSSESSEVRWVPRPALPRHAMDGSMRIRIGDVLESGKNPVVID